MRTLIEDDQKSARGAAREVCDMDYRSEQERSSCVECLRSAYRRRRQDGTLPAEDPRKGIRDARIRSVYSRIEANVVDSRHELDEASKEAVELGLDPDNIDRDSLRELQNQENALRESLALPADILASQIWESGQTAEEGIRLIRQWEADLKKLGKQVAAARRIVNAKDYLGEKSAKNSNYSPDLRPGGEKSEPGGEEW